MSIRRLERKDGTRWEVRYRDGRRNRSRAFHAFESEVKRRKRLGALAGLDAGEERLMSFLAPLEALGATTTTATGASASSCPPLARRGSSHRAPTTYATRSCRY